MIIKWVVWTDLLFKRLENQTDDSELHTRPHVRTVVYINFGAKPACLK